MDKVCRDCGETKPLTEYFKSPRNAGGHSPTCKPCYMERQALYRKKPPREQTPPGTKRCWSCKEVRAEANFSANKDFHDGLNRTCRDCGNARASEYHKKNRKRLNGKQMERYYKDPERYADYDLKRRFGLTRGEYDAMLAAQNGVCAICAGTDPGPRTKRFHVDHNHATGQVRGLLCHHCNHGIGLFREDAVVIQRAIEYLARYSK